MAFDREYSLFLVKMMRNGEILQVIKWDDTNMCLTCRGRVPREEVNRYEICKAIYSHAMIIVPGPV